MPLLMSARALNYLFPGARVDPTPMDHPMIRVNNANESSMNLVGTLLFRLSGNSVETHKGNKGSSHTGPVMDYWYPMQAAVFVNLSHPFIMLVSLLYFHEMWIDCANNPEPAINLFE